MGLVVDYLVVGFGFVFVWGGGFFVYARPVVHLVVGSRRVFVWVHLRVWNR